MNRIRNDRKKQQTYIYRIYTQRFQLQHTNDSNLYASSEYGIKESAKLNANTMAWMEWNEENGNFSVNFSTVSLSLFFLHVCAFASTRMVKCVTFFFLRTNVLK